MENASKALMIAAGALMGMLILSLAVYLYYSLGTYITANQENMNQNELNQFNTQFIKYINYEETTAGPIDVNKIKFELTIHDVVTVANIAYENNKKYNMMSLTETYDESTLYVTVNAEITELTDTTLSMSERKGAHLERNINANSAEILANNNNIQTKFVCKINDIKYSGFTGRVCSITFTKVP